MMTVRCTVGRDSDCDRYVGGDFGDSMDQRSRNLTTSTVNCCMACCYTTGVNAAATATKKYCGKTAKTTSANASCYSSSADTEYDVPPSEAAAFVASASAAVFVLSVALLAVILSSVVVFSLASLAPTAVAATDVSGSRSQAVDYLHRWHQHQREFEQQQQQQQSYPWQLQREQQLLRLDRDGNDDAARRKRQLLKNNNREPGIVSLTFSLIGGTISDAREAYRNVSNIVRDTLSEAAKAQQPTTVATAPSAEGDQMMMAAGNSVENEISTASSADQNMAGQAFSKLFGRNYRGLRRLFNSELRTALRNSPGNVRDFAAELVGSIGQSLRPSKLFTRGPVNGDSATTGNRR